MWGPAMGLMHNIAGALRTLVAPRAVINHLWASFIGFLKFPRHRLGCDNLYYGEEETGLIQSLEQRSSVRGCILNPLDTPLRAFKAS